VYTHTHLSPTLSVYTQTDDVSLEYGYKALKFVAFKSPKQPVPRVAASIEHDFEVCQGRWWWGVLCAESL
jgi:hypothetical protein